MHELTSACICAELFAVTRAENYDKADLKREGPTDEQVRRAVAYILTRPLSETKFAAILRFPRFETMADRRKTMHRLLRNTDFLVSRHTQHLSWNAHACPQRNLSSGLTSLTVSCIQPQHVACT